MKTTAFLSALSICIVGLVIASSAHAATVTFGLSNGTEFDNPAPIGTTMTSDDGNPANAITITTVDARAPEYTDDGGGGLAWDGTSYLFPGTAIHSGNGVYINNPGLGPPSDGGGFNEHESWTIELDRPVVFNEIDFSSLSSSNGDEGRITIDALAISIVFNEGTLSGGSANIMADPFGVGFVIPAGTDIKFEGLDSNNGNVSAWRIPGITVTEVPEPSSLVLLLMSGLAATLIRRKK